MKFICLYLIIFSQFAQSAEYELRGNLEYKLMSYTENTSQNLGHFSLFNFEQKSFFNKKFMALNQLRAKSTSIETDLAEKITTKKQNNFEALLGENYIRFQNDSLIFQMGYQDIVWGESFGFHYADIINPRDERITFYSSQDDVRIPLLLINSKIFFKDGSLQLLYSPEPRFSKTLPIDLFIGDSLIQDQIIVRKESTPKVFKEHEYGFKLSTSFIGSDLSLFYYNYLDRNPYYEISNASLTSITLDEKHSRISSAGVSFAKTLADFVIRSDVVMTKDRKYNYISGLNFSSFQSDSREILVSLDTPSFKKFTGLIIIANKTLSQTLEGAFQNKSETQIIGRITKSLEGDASIDLSYTHDVKSKGKAIQTLIKLPVNNDTILNIGAEQYFGTKESNYGKIKKINNIFFSIKNYFKI
ncbi:MAG: hypothetical protein HOP07_11675 [Bacteriovoracaceae bacterium]|nr:hypothetical protein [Bacteriovoracaceae bacterium]